MPDRRVGERSNHPPQIVRFHPNVAVIHQEILIFRTRKHLRQVADFSVRTQVLFTDQQTNRALWKLQLQALDNFRRRISGLANSENNLVLLIFLHAMAAQALIHFRIRTLEWLENRNRQLRLCSANLP